MKINVNWEQGEKLKASFGKFLVYSDASLANGGQTEHPEPVDYLYVSLALCAGYYLRKFFTQRGLDASACGLELSTAVIDESYKRSITLKVSLPPDFPTKYRPALEKVLDGCTAKKIIQAGPEFKYEIN